MKPLTQAKMWKPVKRVTAHVIVFLRRLEFIFSRKEREELMVNEQRAFQEFVVREEDPARK